MEKDETNTQVITLVQNPNYHLKAQDGSALYKVDKIKILLYLDSNTAIFALRKGYIDILDSAVSSNYLNLLSGEKTFSYRMHRETVSVVWCSMSIRQSRMIPA